MKQRQKVPPAPRSVAAERQWLDRAIERYLRERYRTRTGASVKELAEFLGRSRPHLSRVVPDIFGQTLRAYLRERQLAYAVRLLLETPLSIGEIALAAAFGTERTFFRAFKRAFRQSPAAFRKATKCQ